LIDATKVGGDDGKVVSVVGRLKIDAGDGEIAVSKSAYMVVKRLCDVLISSLILLALLPLFVIIAACIFISSPGPVLYKSWRYGAGGRKFEFLKFRSMYTDADKRQKEMEGSCNEKDGPIFKMKNDPRIIPIGKFLRKFSLDELPQLINVIKGDMSLVGPRPLPCHQGDGLRGRELERMSVPQGMTCFWQVMGRSDLSFQEMVELDLKYVEEISFGTDAKIMLKTPAAVVTGKGAY
jgi:lipopolysaccharide/colanic/teichoic acid biosynthesis glycosyltransferase